jgi:hypothetical protein
MPFTPYHFGPSGFFAVVFRKYLDVPVFLLVNIIVDLEVLYWPKWPVHRVTHTLLFGAIAGAVFGLAAYPLRSIFEKICRAVYLPYKTSIKKAVISGVLGVWLHVLIDAVYHWDVLIFWPSKIRPLYGLLSKGSVRAVCIVFLAAALAAYIFSIKSQLKQKKTS